MKRETIFILKMFVCHQWFGGEPATLWQRIAIFPKSAQGHWTQNIFDESRYTKLPNHYYYLLIPSYFFTSYFWNFYDYFLCYILINHAAVTWPVLCNLYLSLIIYSLSELVFIKEVVQSYDNEKASSRLDLKMGI